MFRNEVGAISQLLVVKRANRLSKSSIQIEKWRISAFGTALEYRNGQARKWIKRDHRRKKMSDRSKFQRNLIAVFASLLMSTVAVGAAVAPAAIAANSSQVDYYA